MSKLDDKGKLDAVKQLDAGGKLDGNEVADVAASGWQ